MLDERTFALLNLINLECQNGGYKVFLIKDLIYSMDKYSFDEYDFLESIERLKNHQYISVKYQDDNEICLTPLIKGRLESEKRLERKIEQIENEKKYFSYSFLGGLCGGVLAGSVALIIKLLGGL